MYTYVNNLKRKADTEKLQEMKKFINWTEIYKIGSIKVSRAAPKIGG